MSLSLVDQYQYQYQYQCSTHVVCQVVPVQRLLGQVIVESVDVSVSVSGAYVVCVNVCVVCVSVRGV